MEDESAPLLDRKESKTTYVNEIYIDFLRSIGEWPVRRGDPSSARMVIVGNTFGRLPIVPDGDIFIHTGNFCDERGGCGAVFISWLFALPHKIKIIIPGLYDSQYVLRQLEHVELGPGMGGVILLNGACTITHGLRIFTPYVDREDPDESIRSYTTDDILLSHLPPHGVLDKISSGKSVGCPETIEMMLNHPPRIMISGGIYTGYGYCWCYLDNSDEPTLCINAAMCAPFDSACTPNPPIVLAISFL